MTNRPFVIQPYLTQVVAAYHNEEMIADAVMPFIKVPTDVFKYTVRPKSELRTIPNDYIGRKGQTNRVEFSGTETTNKCDDYGLEDSVPTSDIDNAAGSNVDPLADATVGVTELVKLNREIRVAGITFNASNYATANKTTLAGGAQWSAFTTSDPVGDILAGIDAVDSGRRVNTMVLGRSVASTLRRHPAILKAFNGNNGDTGIVPMSFLATLFELDKILVGSAFKNTAKPGQTYSGTRIWGKFCALLYINPNPSTKHAETWGFTAQRKPLAAYSYFDPKEGLEGSEIVRVGNVVKEVVVANDYGYLISAAIA